MVLRIIRFVILVTGIVLLLIYIGIMINSSGNVAILRLSNVFGGLGFALIAISQAIKFFLKSS